MELGEQILSSVDTVLPANPYAGRPGRVEGTRELVVHESYIVAYEVTDAVYILTVRHTEDGRVMGTTDCNSFHGTVTVEKHKIRIGENIAMTRKFCAGSQEMEFIGMLQNVSSFFFTSRGQLIMELKYDSGSMFFQ